MSIAAGRGDDWIAALCAHLAQRAGQPVERIETHISVVLLAGEFAYKLRKPLKLPFLDYSSLEKRRQCCEEELRLGARFAPELYLDLVVFGGRREAPELDGDPVREYAVRMRRFDPRQQLDRLCAANALGPAALVDFARALARLQSGFAAMTTAAEASDAFLVARHNLTELRGLLPVDASALLAELTAWIEAEHARLASFWPQRIAAGRVREGHGDLHLGNLVLIDGRIRAFDAIDFDPALRNIDVVSDIAFLWMDLLDHQRPDLAGHFLNAWLEESGDYGGLAALPVHAVHRALVRAKVAALRAAQGDSAQAEKVRGYLSLARHIAAPPAPTLTTSPRPRLVITCGLSGAGKTTASGAWLASDPDARCIRIRSDVERKRLFGLAPLASSAGIPGGIYDAATTRRTFARLEALTNDLLAAGYAVVVDAAFLHRSARDAFRAVAARHRVDFGILWCEAPADELQRRLATRQNDASEATPAIAMQQQDWLEALDARERRDCIAPEVYSSATAST